MLEKIIQIVLWLLAFLGIALLVLLGLVLLLLLLFLFVPIRYRGNFQKDADGMTLRIKGSWLLHFFRIRADYEKEFLIKVYVLFFKVFDSSKPGGKRNASQKIAKYRPQEEEEEEEEETEIPVPSEEAATQQEAMKEVAEEEIPEEEASQEEASEQQEAKASATGSPKLSFVEKLQEKVKNIFCKIKGICGKIKDTVNTIGYYLELLGAEETKALLGRSMSRVLKALKSMCPRRLEAELIIGTGSPDTTGYVMALAGMLYPVLGKHVNIEPDFEKTIFEGRIFFKGRMTLFVFLWQALRIFFDKDLRTVLKKLKREDA